MNGAARNLVVLDAPSNLGLRPPRPGDEPGTRFAPSALRRAGILTRLGAIDAGAVAVPPYRIGRRDDTRIRNLDGVRVFALALAEALEPIVETGRFPVVLGGDCSILLGSMLALRRRGRYGLVFVDGHTDLLTPVTSQTGGAAGMDLALVTGHGPAALADLDGRGPLVDPRDVVAIGSRDGSERSLELARDVATAGAAFVPLADVRRRGLGATSRAAVDHLTGHEAMGFWVHLDVDVLDSTLMPAVASPQPDGLTFDEVIELLRPLLTAPSAVGFQVTVFDPELDTDGLLAQRLVAAIGAAFAADPPSAA